MYESPSLKNITVCDPFWSARQKLVTKTAIPYQERVLNDLEEGVAKSHAITNFKIAAGLEEGEFYGAVFQDSDVAKWIEAVAYSLTSFPDAKLEKRADEIIEIIEKAQGEDGYLNTFFSVKEPEHRWHNLSQCHELYCAGHMMEAAAAYYKATGKDRLLRVMCRMADHIDRRFGPGKIKGIPGHEEIELGLMRLYDVTKEERYLNLALFFLNERGQNPDYFEVEKKNYNWQLWNPGSYNRAYNQSHIPVREQERAVGHCVRAVYLYTAMAEAAKRTGDEGLFNACERLFENISEKQMYVTGNVGQSRDGETFTVDYDLPNDTMYGETCASIGLAFFTKAMLNIKPDGKYADVLERIIYNGALSGMQLDGKRYFYVNPLEVNPGLSGEVYPYHHVKPERPGWYGCACCPPNLVRFIESLGMYAWSESENAIVSHLFLGGKISAECADIELTASYPFEGKASYRIHPKKPGVTFSFHIPGYVKQFKLTLNSKPVEYTYKDGYITLSCDFRDNDTVEIEFPMEVRRVYCSTKVRQNVGDVCLMRGPFVFAFEGTDNGEYIQELAVPSSASFNVIYEENGVLQGLPKIVFDGIRRKNRGGLYSECAPEKETEKMTAIPYFAWANRGKTQMRVWMRED